jgi:hypothetical protein
LSYRFGVVSAWGHSFVHVREQKNGAAENWDEWVAPFLKKVGFVQAWVSDIEFDYWQNAQDPTLYEQAGRDYAELPMIPNGLPPPLRQNIVDISGNPGRRVLRDGYIESVGIRMWLGRSYWKHVAGCEIERLVAAGWTVTKLHDDITKLETDVFYEECSTERQTMLRSALYGV